METEGFIPLAFGVVGADPSLRRTRRHHQFLEMGFQAIPKTLECMICNRRDLLKKKINFILFMGPKQNFLVILVVSVFP